MKTKGYYLSIGCFEDDLNKLIFRLSNLLGISFLSSDMLEDGELGVSEGEWAQGKFDHLCIVRYNRGGADEIRSYFNCKFIVQINITSGSDHQKISKLESIRGSFLNNEEFKELHLDVDEWDSAHNY